MAFTSLGLHDLGLSTNIAIVFLFLGIIYIAHRMTTSHPRIEPHTNITSKTEYPYSQYTAEGDSGYESSDDEDHDGLEHLRKALRMVNQNARARRNSDDFEMFAKFASASQRRAMRRASHQA